MTTTAATTETFFYLTKDGRTVRADLVINEDATSFELGETLGTFADADTACFNCERMGYALHSSQRGRKFA